MRFYTQQREFYCGIDLHARSMYLCILDRDGKIVLHHNMASAPDPFLKAIEPYRGNLVVGVECIFCWYWLADLCAAEKIEFVLGHALYMKAIHGGKAKNDKIDAYKIASLLRGGNFPLAYAYPSEMRATRDLLRTSPTPNWTLKCASRTENCNARNTCVATTTEILIDDCSHEPSRLDWLCASAS
jgi:transposase